MGTINFLKLIVKFWKIVNVKGIGADSRFNDTLRGKIPKKAKFSILLIAVNSYDKNTSQTCKIYKYNIFFQKNIYLGP